MEENPRIPDTSTEIVTELFQIRIGFYERDQSWHAVVHSVEDNQTMNMGGKNIGKLLAAIRSVVLQKEKELRGEQEKLIITPNGNEYA